MTGFTRTLKRKTEATKYQRGRAAQIVIEIPAGGRVVGFRLAKTRRTFYLPTADLLALAIRVTAQAERDRKKLERKERKRIGAH